MRLAAKLTSALVLAICLVSFGFALLQIRRETALFELELAKDQRLMGHTLRVALEDTWQDRGGEAALALIAHVNAGRADGVRFRWVWLDSPSGAADGLPANEPPITSTESVIRTDADGVKRRFTYVPTPTPDGRSGAIEISEPLASQESYLHATKLLVLVATGATALVSALLTLWLGFALVGRPVRRLVTMARRIGAGDLTGHLDASQRDEIGDLGRELNLMCDQLADSRQRLTDETEARIAAIEQLRHADRLKTIGQLASGVAHELGTPLNVVAARAKMIQTRSTPGGDIASQATIIGEQAARMTTIIRGLLDFSRRREPTLVPVDVPAVVERTIALLTPLAAKRGVRVLFVPQPTIAMADAAQLQQVLANLVLNGVHAMPNGGAVTITIDGPIDADGGRWHRIAIRDEGSGIAPENLPRIFEPFFTTKGAGEGTGLGLSVTQGIVRDHGGWIAVDSAPGRGTTMSIHLPVLPRTLSMEACA